MHWEIWAILAVLIVQAILKVVSLVRPVASSPTSKLSDGASIAVQSAVEKGVKTAVREIQEAATAQLMSVVQREVHVGLESRMKHLDDLLLKANAIGESYDRQAKHILATQIEHAAHLKKHDGEIAELKGRIDGLHERIPLPLHPPKGAKP